MKRTVLIGLLFAAACAACSREEGLRCEDPSRYRSSATVPPIRVPDDLTVPDESESLLIPDVAGSSAPPAAVPQECLETPPDFFGNEAPN